MESLSKNKIKWIRSLRQKKNRDKENLFIVEGEKIVREFLSDWSESIVCICATETDIDFNGEIYSIDERVLKDLSSLKTPNKYLAVVRKPHFKNVMNQFVLAVDGVQDPGNMGTILRTADWFNVDKVVCSKETVDIYNSKVIQSSMGSIFRIPVEYVNLAEFIETSTIPTYGALLEGENIYKMNCSKPAVIVVGNEGKGISDEIVNRIEHKLHIPAFGGAESLNVSIATGIILSEFSR